MPLINKHRKMDKSRIVAFAFIGLGIVALGYGVYQLQMARQSASWSVAEGRIEGVDIEVSTTTRKRSSSSHPPAHQKKTRYYFSLTYSYVVDGQTHRASRYAFGRGSRVGKAHRTRAEALKAARAFPTGDPIPVYYDPSDPSEAVIIAGVSGAIWLPFLFGLLFVGLGGFLYFPNRFKKLAAS